MSGTKHPIYGADGRAGLGQSRPTPMHRDADMTKNEAIINAALNGKALAVRVTGMTKTAYKFSVVTFENGEESVSVKVSDIRSIDLANLAAESA